MRLPVLRHGSFADVALRAHGLTFIRNAGLDCESRQQWETGQPEECGADGTVCICGVLWRLAIDHQFVWVTAACIYSPHHTQQKAHNAKKRHGSDKSIYIETIRISIQAVIKHQTS